MLFKYKIGDVGIDKVTKRLKNKFTVIKSEIPDEIRFKWEDGIISVSMNINTEWDSRFWGFVKETKREIRVYPIVKFMEGLNVSKTV